MRVRVVRPAEILAGVVLAALGVLAILGVLVAGPAGAQVPSRGCYPPPCAPAGVEPGGAMVHTLAPAGTTVAPGGASPVPVVVVGLTMVMLSFAAIASVRRKKLVRRAPVSYLLAPRSAERASADPDRSFGGART